MSQTALKDETTDLKLHAHLCAERYQGIQDHFDNLERRMDRVEGKVDLLKDEINNGNKTMKSTVIGAAVSIVVAMIGMVAAVITM